MAAATATATATAAGHVHHQQPLFRVVGTALVAPAAAAAGPRSIPLTFFDVKWLHLPPVERVLLYRLSPDADVPASGVDARCGIRGAKTIEMLICIKI
jgi:hypothetical protein